MSLVAESRRRATARAAQRKTFDGAGGAWRSPYVLPSAEDSLSPSADRIAPSFPCAFQT
jgi:hypothetical protein